MNWTKEELETIISNFQPKRTKEECWMQTRTGLSVNFVDPSKEMIDIMDIAHAISQESRYSGHTKEFFSVAQHSLLVEAIVSEMGGSIEERMQALLHDASEAYLKDISSPLKDLLPFYQVLEARFRVAIGDAFKVNLTPLPQIVKDADRMALAIEAHQFFEKVEWVNPVKYDRVIAGVSGPNGKLEGLPPFISKEAFLNKYWNLHIKLQKEA